ncbi:hypothetical protein B879_04042 [Cecembia lonarensis LW9]|uniref:Uncharacterized protein n=1 Tax=Cecembia lonarensis (strain CCUG 58316 / KCTC 22772 / LW9) TaxID=1225176 RepID=K1LAD8_CECL9|nr:hypothetical protein B879_04042 [Cecembia lonarensis LW9]
MLENGHYFLVKDMHFSIKLCQVLVHFLQTLPHETPMPVITLSRPHQRRFKTVNEDDGKAFFYGSSQGLMVP